MDILQTVNYFDIVSQAQKSYGKLLDPICKKWELTRNELDIILFLSNNPKFDRAADIVSRRGIAKSHVSLSVANLEDRGLLTRCFAPSDRRSAHLKLTPQAQTIAREGQTVQKDYFTRIFADVSPQEFALWRALTEKVCRNIENLNK